MIYYREILFPDRDMPIVFVRHAESVSNAGGVTMPHAMIPLSDHGHRQASELSLALPKSRVVLVSEFLRAQQTAQPYCRQHEVEFQVVPLLNEFSIIDEKLIEGLTGPERKPFVRSYWDDPDPHRRLGDRADTFAEFDARVATFRSELMDRLESGTVVFGHGIWIAMLHWQLQGHRVTDSDSMRAFRKFQLSLPMPNCAILEVPSPVEVLA